jgi:hypothetical protein
VSSHLFAILQSLVSAPFGRFLFLLLFISFLFSSLFFPSDFRECFQFRKKRNMSTWNTCLIPLPRSRSCSMLWMSQEAKRLCPFLFASSGKLGVRRFQSFHWIAPTVNPSIFLTQVFSFLFLPFLFSFSLKMFLDLGRGSKKFLMSFLFFAGKKPLISLHFLSCPLLLRGK